MNIRGTETQNSLAATLSKSQKLISEARYADAEKLLKNLIRKKYFNPEVYILLGKVLIQQNRHNDAESLFRKALSMHPKHPPLLCNLAVLLTRKNKLMDALGCYEKAIHADHAIPQAHYNMGIIYRQLGMPEKAIVALELTIKLNPRFYQAHNSLGNIYRDTGNLESAIEHYSIALSLEPNSASIHLNIAATLHKLGKSVQSLCHYKKALKITPHNADALIGIATTVLDLGQYHTAKNYYRQALKYAPNSEEALLGFANACYSSGDLDEAEEYYRHIILKNPRHIKALNNLANTLHELHAHNEAIEIYQEALKETPDDADVHFNLCNTLTEIGKIDKATSHINKAIELGPEFPEYHWALARCLLLSGQLEKGWKEYEWRIKRNEKQLRKFNLKQWKGEPLKNKIIIIHAEQGIGDEIIFSSCIPDLIQQSETVILDCEPRLVPIFQRSFPEVLIHGGRQNEDISWVNQYPPADYHVPIASLPPLLRPDIKSFPRLTHFLSADEEKCKRWKELLGQLQHNVSIGISWKGGASGTSAEERSISLMHLLDILSLPGFNIINIQYGDHSNEIQEFSDKTGINIHTFKSIDPLCDMDNFAALISELDLVISVDNSTAHISGALGVPTWILLPYIPDWRWFLGTTTSPWYASVRLFRQDTPGIWNGALFAAHEELRKYLENTQQ